MKLMQEIEHKSEKWRCIHAATIFLPVNVPYMGCEEDTRRDILKLHGVRKQIRENAPKGTEKYDFSRYRGEVTACPVSTGDTSVCRINYFEPSKN